jgi:hypothetical protein
LTLPALRGTTELQHFFTTCGGWPQIAVTAVGSGDMFRVFEALETFCALRRSACGLIGG